MLRLTASVALYPQITVIADTHAMIELPATGSSGWWYQLPSLDRLVPAISLAIHSTDSDCQTSVLHPVRTDSELKRWGLLDHMHLGGRCWSGCKP